MHFLEYIARFSEAIAFLLSSPAYTDALLDGQTAAYDGNYERSILLWRSLAESGHAKRRPLRTVPGSR
jgi:hypothetical protein